MKRFLLIFILIALYSNNSFGATINAVQTGNWSSRLTWSISKAGTISYTTGSTTVTGSGTSFTTVLSIGDVIFDATKLSIVGTVASITSNTVLLLNSNATTTFSGSSWSSSVVPTSSDDVIIGTPNGATTITVTVDVTNAACNTLVFESEAGGNNYSLTISTGNTLTVTGGTTLSLPNGTCNTTLTVNGTFTTTVLSLFGASGGTTRITELAIASGTANITGDITMSANANAKLTVTGTGRLNHGGNMIKNACTTCFAISATVTFASTSIINLNGINTNQALLNNLCNFGNVYINNTGTGIATTKSAVTATNVTGDIIVQSGTLSNQGAGTTVGSVNAVSTFLAIAGNAGKTFEVDNGATFQAAGTSTFPSGFGTITLQPTSTVNYIGTTQTISPQNFGNLTISDGASAGRAVTLSSTGTIGVYTNFTPSSVNNVYTITSSTVSFNGTLAQTLPSNFATYNNLTINNAAGVTLTADVTYNAVLTLTSGIITTGSFSLIAPSTGSVSRTSGHVFGNFKKWIPSTAAKTFQVGTASDYTPMDVTFASVTTAGYVTGKSTGGDHPSMGSSCLDGNRSVNAYYTLTNNTAVVGTFTIAFSYLATDVDGSATASSFNVKSYAASTWAALTVSPTPTTTLTTVTGVSTFGDYEIADPGITINTQPSSGSLCSGVNTSFSVTASGTSLTYQWQESTNSGSSFSNITNGGVYSTATTATLTLTGITTSMSGYQYRCTVGGCSGSSSNSNAATLTVNSNTAPTISAGGVTTFCSGCSVTLTSNSQSSYLWSTGATTQSITASATGNYTVNNGCATSAATSVTVNTCTSHTWTGSTSSAWATTTNWNKCAAPGTADDVTIPNVTNAPVISATANCNSLTINASSSLTINSGNTLNVYGNITNNGTYTNNGTTVFAGSGAQSVTGATTFNNLTVNNAAGVTLNNATTVNGILTLTSGTLASGGNLTVNLNTGAIDGSGSGSISGNIITSKTVSSGSYHMVACPLTGLTANDWNDNVPIKSGYYANFYTYDETNTDTSKSVGWTAQTSLSTALTSMKGFALYFNGSASLDQTGAYTHSATYTSPTLTNTVSLVGGSNNPSADGWNLVGNPYPSAIDWSAGSGWTKTGLDNAIYCWDPVNNRYASYVSGSGTNGGTQYIPSMQAFWVKVTSAGTGSLAMTNSVRVTSTNPAIWRMASLSDILKLTASSGTYSDETIIRFREGAKETFDSELDAYKMDNEENTPTLYTELAKDQYSINTLPYPSQKLIIPVKLNAAFTGNYTFSAEEMGSFASGDSIIFVDKLLGVQQDLRSNPVYICAVSKGDTSGRFYIHYKKAEESKLSLSSPVPSIKLRSMEDQIKIQFFNDNSNRASIGIYNMMGQEEFKIEDADISSKEFSIQLSKARAGVYIVKSVTPSQSFSGKVYLFK